MELERAIAHLSDKAEICAELSRLTSHKLVAQTGATGGYVSTTFKG